MKDRQKQGENEVDNDESRGASDPPAKTTLLPQSDTSARRHRRILAVDKNGDHNAAGTKAKVAKLLMDARREMAAFEKEHNETQSTNALMTGLSMAPNTSTASETISLPIQLITQVINVRCLIILT